MSANVSLNNQALILGSSPAQASWGVYDFYIPWEDARDCGYLTLHLEPVGAQPVYIGVSNFDRGAWEWRQVELIAGVVREVNVELGVGVDYSGDPKHGSGSALFVAIVAQNGNTCLVHELDYYRNQRDASITGLSASQGVASDAVEITWDPIEGATHYWIYLDDPADAPGEPTPEVKVTAGLSSFVHNQLTVAQLPPLPARSYDYYVFGVFPDGLLSHPALVSGSTAP